MSRKPFLDAIEFATGISIDPNPPNSESSNRDLGGELPGIPPLVIGAICLWASTAASFTYSEMLDSKCRIVVLTICAVLAIVFSLIFIRARNLIMLALLFAALGIVFGESASYLMDVSGKSLPENGTYQLRLVEDPKKSSRGEYAQAECLLDSGKKLKVTAFFNDATTAYMNARVSAKCSFSEPKDDYKHSSYMSGVSMQANVSEYEVNVPPFPESVIYDIRKGAIEKIGSNASDRAGIMQALLCGFRATIQEDGSYEKFKRCGIAHIVAVSGAHLAIVSAALGIVLSFFKFPRMIFVATNLFFILAYLLFAGLPISAIRAAVMCSLALISGLAKRRNATLNSLAICVIAFILFDPICSVSISLFLSAASTFGIVLFSKIFSSWGSKLPSMLRDGFVAPLSMTLSANLMTLPFSAAIFGIIPLVAPISNVLVAPFFTLSCIGGIVALVIAFLTPELEGVVLGIASLFARPLNGIADVLSVLPNSVVEADLDPVPMLALTAFLALFLIVKKPKVKGFQVAMALITLLAFICVPKPGLINENLDRIIMLDVGQGDSFVVQSEGKALLIDTGDDPSKLRDSLNYAAVKDLDAVSISHPDSDHCAALEDINVLTKNAKFICTDEMTDCDCAKCSNLVDIASRMVGRTNIIKMKVGDRFQVGNFILELVWPHEYSDEGGNADSMCMLASLDVDKDGVTDYKILFTGDAESDQLEEAFSGGSIGDIDVLKVGHHGSRNSLSKSLLNSIKPEFALISVGEENSYGHPTQTTISALNDANAEIFRTDESGVVEAAFTKDGIRFTKQKA